MSEVISTEIRSEKYVNFIIEGEEMLRLEKDAIYVQGVKVGISDTEALSVYNSFNQWLVWAQLQRKY